MAAIVVRDDLLVAAHERDGPREHEGGDACAADTPRAAVSSGNSGSSLTIAIVVLERDARGGGVLPRRDRAGPREAHVLVATVERE